MASSKYFGSGLNNWEATDKPARLDFVNDNRIVDEKAMWKSVYDPDGTVAGAQGIKNIVGQMVAQASGFVVHTHSKTGTAHSLTHSGAQAENIKFVAKADFMPGDTLKIDGAAVTVRDCDGAAIGKAWAAGNTVTLLRSGSTVMVTAPLMEKATVAAVNGIVPITAGGTGANTAAAARSALSVYSAAEITGWTRGTLTFTGIGGSTSYAGYEFNPTTRELHLFGYITGSGAVPVGNPEILNLTQIPGFPRPLSERYIYCVGEGYISKIESYFPLTLLVKPTGKAAFGIAGTNDIMQNNGIARLVFNTRIILNGWGTTL